MTEVPAIWEPVEEIKSEDRKIGTLFQVINNAYN
jgi:hypothetical protein